MNRPLPPDLLLIWTERAAIIEYEGNRPREEAERMAWMEIEAIITRR
jgi:hypothetical protein